MSLRKNLLVLSACASATLVEEVSSAQCPPGGHWAYYYYESASGQPSSEDEACVRADGTHHGPTMTWQYGNGSKQLATQGNFEDGRRHGPWRWWSFHGQSYSRHLDLEGTYDHGLKDGPWISWYKNGNKRTESSYMQGLPDGPWTEWWPQGQLSLQSHYLLGAGVGPVVRYWQTGVKETEATRVDIHGESVSTSYDQAGHKTSEATYRGGFREGPAIDYDPYSGNKIRETTFKGGKRHGVSFEWRNGRLVMQGEYLQELPWGTFSFWDAGGQLLGSYPLTKGNGPIVFWDVTTKRKESEGLLKSGLRDGIWITYYPSGVRQSEVAYKDGKRHGPSVLFREDGKKREEGEYREDLPWGVFTYWDRAGQVVGKNTLVSGTGAWTDISPWEQKLGQMLDGLKQGDWKVMEPNGRVVRQEQYARGVLDGVCVDLYLSGAPRVRREWRRGQQEGTERSYYENGADQSSATYAAGQREGESRYWDERGVLRSVSQYRAGKLHGLTVYFDSAGQKLREIIYDMGEDLVYRTFGAKKAIGLPSPPKVVPPPNTPAQPSGPSMTVTFTGGTVIGENATISVYNAATGITQYGSVAGGSTPSGCATVLIGTARAAGLQARGGLVDVQIWGAKTRVTVARGCQLTCSSPNCVN